MASFDWPSSGGGAGTIQGPTSSVVNSVAVWADTKGTTLADSQTTNTLLLPTYPGAPASGYPVVPNIPFAGTGFGGAMPANTGFLGETSTSFDTVTSILSIVVEGFQLMRFDGPVLGNDQQITVNYRFRPDTSIAVDVGLRGNSFVNYWGRTFDGGANTSGNGSDMSRFMLVTHQGWSAGTGIGMGFDASSGGEAYFQLWDPTADDQYYTAFSCLLNNHIATLTTASSSTSTTGNHLLLQGGANSSTGAGGDLLLSGSTSTSGTPGCVQIPTTSGTPSFTPTTHSGFAGGPLFDPATNKLYMYSTSASAWKSVTLS